MIGKLFPVRLSPPGHVTGHRHSEPAIFTGSLFSFILEVEGKLGALDSHSEILLKTQRGVPGATALGHYSQFSCVLLCVLEQHSVETYSVQKAGWIETSDSTDTWAGVTGLCFLSRALDGDIPRENSQGKAVNLISNRWSSTISGTTAPLFCSSQNLLLSRVLDEIML